jgi:hypothetical protein
LTVPHVVKTGKTPVLEGTEWRKLLNSIPATNCPSHNLLAAAGSPA